MSKMSEGDAVLAARDREIAGLRELLDERQRFDVTQGARIDELERALGETQAKLRSAQQENARLMALLNGYTGKPGGAR